MNFRLAIQRVGPVLSSSLLATTITTSPRCFRFSGGPPQMEENAVYYLKPNIYMTRGTPNPVSYWQPEVGRVRARVEMPGVSPELLKIKVDDETNSIYIQGSEVLNFPDHYNTLFARTYTGRFIFDPYTFHAKDYVSDFNNGVLWLEINCFSAIISYYINPVKLIRNAMAKGKQMWHPLVSQGWDRFYTFCFTEEAFVIAVDVPSLADGDQRLSVEGEKISFRAQQNRKHPFEQEVGQDYLRVYEGAFDVDLQEFDAQSTKSVIEHGILWIEVPKRVNLPPGSKDQLTSGWVRLRFGTSCLFLRKGT